MFLQIIESSVYAQEGRENHFIHEKTRYKNGETTKKHI